MSEHPSRKKENGVYTVKLNGKLPVLCEPIKGTYSTVIAVWFLQGSRDEEREEEGLAHFLEHMFFKGTAKRSVYDIAMLFDRIGGQVDAFTTKEYVCFYARVLQEHVPVVVDLISDILLFPKFDKDEMEKERSVILEELRGAHDDPHEFAAEQFIRRLWPNHTLGRPIGGSQSAVLRITHEQLLRFFERQLFPENMLITAAGALDVDGFYALIEDKFRPLLNNSGSLPERFAPDSERFRIYIPRKQLQQTHIYLGGSGYSLKDPRRYAYGLLLSLLGDGMSSRLFLKVREELGLVYSIGSSISSYSDAGAWAIYAGTVETNVMQTIEAILHELTRLTKEFVSEEELERAKEKARANFLMSWESASDRMFKRAKQYVFDEPYDNIHQMIEHFRKVTLEDIFEVACDIFQEDNISMLILGDLNNETVTGLGTNFSIKLIEPSELII